MATEPRGAINRQSAPNLVRLERGQKEGETDREGEKRTDRKENEERVTDERKEREKTKEVQREREKCREWSGIEREPRTNCNEDETRNKDQVKELTHLNQRLDDRKWGKTEQKENLDKQKQQQVKR